MQEAVAEPLLLRELPVVVVQVEVEQDPIVVLVQRGQPTPAVEVAVAHLLMVDITQVEPVALVPREPRVVTAASVALATRLPAKLAAMVATAAMPVPTLDLLQAAMAAMAVLAPMPALQVVMAAMVVQPVKRQRTLPLDRKV